MRNYKTILLATVAGALLTPQVAMAKAHSHHKYHASDEAQEKAMMAQLQAAQQQIAALQAQLDALKAKVDQASAAQSQTAVAAQNASTKADEALAKASTAQTTAVAANEKASKPAEVPAPVKWAADTKISGRMYFNMSQVSASDANGTNVENNGGFQIKRFYVSVDHRFNKVLSGDITTDIKQVDGLGQTLFVKKAYLQASFNPAFTVRLGSADMPWIPYVEGIYGYRQIDNTLTDLDHYANSADWGVHVLGKLADGIVSYQVSVVDGAGYRKPQFSKSVDVEGRVSIAYHGLQAAVGGYTGKRGLDQQGITTYHTASRFDALLGYKGRIQNVGFTLGGEYFYAKNWNNVTTVAEDAAEGYSIFASIQPVAKWSVFGRYDWVKPSKDLNPDYRDHYFNAGIQYSPAKIVDLALVYKHDSGTQDLKIGNLGAGQATRDEVGLYGQFRW